MGVCVYQYINIYTHNQGNEKKIKVIFTNDIFFQPNFFKH